MSDGKLQDLEGRISNRISTVQSAMAKFRDLNRTLSVQLACLGAASTLFIAISQYDFAAARYLSILALIASAIITIVSAWESATKPREKFIQNADALNELFDVKARLDWRKLKEGEPLKEAEIDAFFAEFRVLEKGFFGSIARIHIESDGAGGS